MSERRIQMIKDPIVGQWVIDRLDDPDLRTIDKIGTFMAYGILKDGKPVAGVIFNWYREMQFGSDMRVIIAADDSSWCLPGVLRELFAYPFIFANCERLTAVIRDGNARSLKLCRGLGFRQEGVLRRGFDGRSNALILGMLKHECKWLKPRHELRTWIAAQAKQRKAKAPHGQIGPRSRLNGSGASASQ